MQKERSIPTDFHQLFWQDKIPLTDSRQLQVNTNMVFFALQGPRHDGHAYIEELYKRGVRYFIVDLAYAPTSYEEAIFLAVQSPLNLLQNWAKAHRSKFNLKVLAITGSNGKTIVKEYLYQLLQEDLKVVKSPKSYNSQLGVPLSVLQIKKEHQLAIFEAGISQTNEMAMIAPIIQPQVGIFTNIGAAHSAGFRNQSEKIQEKLLLFDSANSIIYRKTDQLIDQAILKRYADRELWSWGAHHEARIPIYLQKETSEYSIYELSWQGAQHLIKLPFHDPASVENALHSVTFMLLHGCSIALIQERVKLLRNIPMRLELKAGINGCLLIDDSYNNDLRGLAVALDFMHSKIAHNYLKKAKTVILSDIAESAMPEKNCYLQVAQLLKSHKIDKLVAIGPALCRQQSLFQEISAQYFFTDTASCLLALRKNLSFQQETILLKGARAFEFEQLARRLRPRNHRTQLEFDLQALSNNFNCYRKLIKAETKIMVMVKAFAYGSNSYELARLLEASGVDYLGVAYADEGVQLRLDGIKLPIMVMNTNKEDFQDLIDYQLEPAVYSISMLKVLRAFVDQIQLPQPLQLHIELDTGMHRLGFSSTDFEQLIPLVRHKNLNVKAIFSHLAAADEDKHEAFSIDQIKKFSAFAARLEERLGYSLIKHILNSAGISRFAAIAQFDMLRLGIGLHGFDPNHKIKGLKTVARLSSLVSQVRQVPAGTSVGYSRASISTKDRQIATIAIGYADGLMRAFSKGVGKVWIKGQLCPIVGNICMDMCFADVSGLAVKEGDEVEIFGANISVISLANAIGSIPYEILTNISQRVPRIFYEA